MKQHANMRAHEERIVRIFDRRGIALVTDVRAAKSQYEIVHVWTLLTATKCRVRTETFLHFCDYLCIS